ncbi:MAG: O-antigen ligase family protein, partial [Alphaproteobacteria bacterium]|nr:O-antigen ligase family protein [Alphaproteobacteria bacterium]
MTEDHGGRPSREDRLDRHRLQLFDFLLRVLFGIVGPMAYLAPLGLAILLPLLAGALLLDARRRRGAGEIAEPLRRAPFLWALGLLALVSAFWALVPGAAAVEAIRLLAETFIGLTLLGMTGRLSEDARRRVAIALAVGFGAAALLMIADAALGGPLFVRIHQRPLTADTIANSYSRGAILHALILPPLLIALLRWRYRVGAALSLAVAAAAVYSLHSASAKLALPCGLGVALVTYRWIGFGRILALGQCAAILALPFLLLPMPDPGSFCGLAARQPSALHRLYIWQFVDRHIMERPLLGWGMDAARTLAGPGDIVTLYRCATADHPRQAIGMGGLLPLHPHNAILQIWLEFGALGALAAAAALRAMALPLFAKGGERAGAAAAAGTLAAA